MLTATLTLLAGLVILVVGGEFLVRGAVKLAERAGLSQLLIGLTVVAFGTSAPELVASVEAARAGSPGIAWGNIVGSNLANSLLIMGLAAVIYPLAVERKPLWRDAGLGLAATAMLYACALAGVVGVIEGVAAIGLLILYLIYAYRSERQSGAAEYQARTDEAALAGPHDAQVAPTPLWRSGLFLLAGLGGIILGGQWLVSSAVEIAAYLGMSETTIGLTVVAIGTSLPEAVTSIIAAMKKASAVALGNVLGSNIFNLLLIGGVTAIVAPGSVPADLMAFGLPMLIGVSILLLVFATTNRRLGRREGGILLAVFLVQIGYSLSTG